MISTLSKGVLEININNEALIVKHFLIYLILLNNN